MAYKVLYRKYRPDNFENIIGQDYIIKTLKNSIISNNISHAYIFSGPRGTGKTSTAKVFSKAINCLNPKDGSPCGECEFCKNFKDNPDIIEIDAASNNGVDEIRALIDNVKLIPTNGKYKIYIIDEVHMLTISAFNALLLTLEEPPSHTIFILATTNIENVPITILSRCQRFDFQKIKVETLVDRLKEICKLENINISADALEEIASLSEGGMRDALSLLDQLSKNSDEITLDLIEKQIKTVSQKVVSELLDYIEENSPSKCLELINDFRVRAVDYKTLVKKIISIASKRAKNIKLTSKKRRLTFIDYKNMILALSDSLNKTNINVDSYTIMEMILLDFFDQPNVEDIKKPVEINEKVEEPKIIKQENNFNPELIDIRVNNCFANAQKKYLESLKSKLQTLPITTNLDGKIKSILLDSSLVAASDKYMIFTMSNDHSVENANNLLNEIEDVINKEIKDNYKIIFLSENRWNNERNKYIANLKNKVKYELIEEKESCENNDQSEENIINDVFDINKVEII